MEVLVMLSLTVPAICAVAYGLHKAAAEGGEYAIVAERLMRHEYEVKKRKRGSK